MLKLSPSILFVKIVLYISPGFENLQGASMLLYLIFTKIPSDSPEIPEEKSRTYFCRLMAGRGNGVKGHFLMNCYFFSL